ncbi:MAG: tetratricopeptide repeat protein [Comamonadaceae bacterium]|nr:tetratricopeptide repeat protein [Comamonadaceae bacterium]
MIILRCTLTALAIVGLSPGVWARCQGVPTSSGAFAAQIVSVSGRGETRPPNQEIWTPATLAQLLASGAAVRTLAQSSAAVLLADRTQIRMSALSQLFLCDAQPTQTWLELGVGRLWARSKKVPAALTLQTPAAVAGIRGTDWDVEVDAAGRTTLTVLSGQIDLSNAWGRVELGPSEQGFAEPGKAPVKRLIVNPRERVQWVMANPVDVRRWVEFQGADGAGLLAALQAELQSGDWTAVRLRLVAMAHQPESAAVAALMLADMDVFDGRLEEAQSRLEQAWQRTQDPRTAARRTELLLALDRGPQARAWLDATRATAPDASALLLADADWQRLEGHGDVALALYRRALARATENTQRAAAWAGLGRALQERGDLSAARDALAHAVRLAPNNASYLGAQATVAAEALRLAPAQQGFEQALALAGDDYVSLAGAGLLALQQGQATLARELLLKALMIEPAYARAQVWLAVAEYTLGERSAALDSLDRARLADPKDPLPWQIQSMLYNDSGEPAQAMASAREALTRLPYLKSLNPLASDSQGSANLGKALGDIGLEHWARAYASASYYPLWAGSHFFLADRFESQFNRKSELIQGYLSDPTVFGASDKRAPLLLTTGSEWAATVSAEHNALRHNATFDLDHRGFAAVPMPVSWLLRFNDVQTWPHDGSPTTRYRMSSPGVDVALGLRPSERLALFGLHSDSILTYRFPDGLDFGNGITFSSDAQTRTQRSDLGASWRWSADSQTWLKLHSDKNQTALDLDDQVWGPRYYRFNSDEQGIVSAPYIDARGLPAQPGLGAG